jgi:hypothetical protein
MFQGSEFRIGEIGFEVEGVGFRIESCSGLRI